MTWPNLDLSPVITNKLIERRKQKQKPSRKALKLYRAQRFFRPNSEEAAAAQDGVFRSIMIDKSVC